MSVFLLAMGFLLPFIALGSLAHDLPIFLIKSLFGWLKIPIFFDFILMLVADSSRPCLGQVEFLTFLTVAFDLNHGNSAHCLASARPWPWRYLREHYRLFEW